MLVGGDRHEEIERFFAANYRGLLAFAISLTSNVEDAQDRLHDAAEKVTRSWNRITKNPFGYTCRAIENEVKNEARRGKARPRTAPLDLGPEPRSGHDPARSAIFNDQLRTLTAEEYEVFVMFAFGGFSHKEISQRLFIGERTVGNRLHAAEQKLDNG